MHDMTVFILNGGTKVSRKSVWDLLSRNFAHLLISCSVASHRTALRLPRLFLLRDFIILSYDRLVFLYYMGYGLIMFALWTTNPFLLNHIIHLWNYFNSFNKALGPT